MTGRKIGPYLVATAITGLLVFLAYLIFFVPQATATEGFRAQTAAEKTTNAGLQSKVNVLEEKKKNLAMLTGQVDNLTAAFPSKVNTQDLFSAILQAASASGVTITTLNPAAPVLGTEDQTLSTGVVAGTAGTAAQAAKATPTAAKPPVAAKTPATGDALDSAPVAAAPTSAVNPLSSIAVIGLNITARGSQDQLRAFLTNVENLQRPLVLSGVEFTSGKDDTSLILTGNTFLTKPLSVPKAPESANPAAPAATPAPSVGASK